MPRIYAISDTMHSAIAHTLNMGATAALIYGAFHYYLPTTTEKPAVPPSGASADAPVGISPIANVSLPLSAPRSAPAKQPDPVGEYIYFYFDGCPECTRISPEIAKLEKAKYPIRRVDVMTGPGRTEAEQYGAVAYPYLVVAIDGIKVDSVLGYSPSKDLMAIYNDAMKSHRPAIKKAEADSQEKGRPWESVVRLTFPDRRGYSVGSGTIVDSAADRSIILSCSHIVSRPGWTGAWFRRRSGPDQDVKGAQGTVELFDGQLVDPGGQTVRPTGEKFACEVLDIDRPNDVSLITFRPGKILPFSRVTGSSVPMPSGTKVFTTGCNEGKDPTVWSAEVVRAINKADGKPGYSGGTVCSHQPNQGRSGGGLFDHETEELIGVCDFADPKENVGIYASGRSILAILDHNSLQYVHGADATPKPTPPDPLDFPPQTKERPLPFQRRKAG